MIIELLQQIGLSKYDAEAYYALLQHGPLTGYELGKRSGVPLSRSYEILERLHAKGLALVQPGDPPRYTAEAPEQFLARTRQATLSVIDELERGFAELARPQEAAGFWVVRGREAALAQARTRIGASTRSIMVSSATDEAQALEAALQEAQERGCRVQRMNGEVFRGQNAALLLVIDEREAMVGTLHPVADCQCVISSNSAFVTALRRSLVPFTLTPTAQAENRATANPTRPFDWLDWEDRKQRQLLTTHPPDAGTNRIREAQTP
jgi:HTH-type transcriptional regulator, sugar sensing transcriptional regulator